MTIGVDKEEGRIARVGYELYRATYVYRTTGCPRQHALSENSGCLGDPLKIIHVISMSETLSDDLDENLANKQQHFFTTTRYVIKQAKCYLSINFKCLTTSTVSHSVICRDPSSRNLCLRSLFIF